MSLKSNLATTLALIIGFAVLAGATAAKPALRDDPVIIEGLIATAIAYEVGRRCDSLDARVVQGITFLYSLRAHAEGLGYSGREIDAFIDSKAEKDRLEAMARERLRDKGGVDGEWGTYCAVGRAEIAAGSQIGLLLR